jgi:endoglucanase
VEILTVTQKNFRFFRCATALIFVLLLVFIFFPQPAQATTRMRGVMVGSSCDYDFQTAEAHRSPIQEAIDKCAARLNNDIRDLGLWKTNIIRFQLVTNEPRYFSLDGYQEWIKWELAVLDKVRPTCETYGINIVVDLHRVPSIVQGSDQNRTIQPLIFTDGRAQKMVRAVWEQIATRYKNAPRIYGYDLVNEPPSSGNVARRLLNWTELAKAIASDIRKIDQRPYIIIEPRDGRPRYISDVPIINDPRVIYSVHHYDPLEFTAPIETTIPTTRIAERQNLTYPDNARDWNKRRLKQILQPVKNFADQNPVKPVKILIGEFSAARYYCYCHCQLGCRDNPDCSLTRNPCTVEQAYNRMHSSANYLRDSIEIFEEFGFDWIYHAFREALVWNVEETGSDPRGRESLDLLKSFFECNFNKKCDAKSPN